MPLEEFCFACASDDVMSNHLTLLSNIDSFCHRSPYDIRAFSLFPVSQLQLRAPQGFRRKGQHLGHYQAEEANDASKQKDIEAFFLFCNKRVLIDPQ